MTEEIEYVLMDGQIYAKSIKMDTKETVHEEEKPFKCSICDAAFTCEKNVRIHAQLSHTSMDNFQLETFPSNTQMTSSDFNLGHENYHISVHDGKNIMKNNSNMEVMYSTSIKENTSKNTFQCELCNRNFEHEQDLYVHKWAHTGNKPSEVKKKFPCNICTHSYDKSYKLKRHHISVHEGIRFSCTLCEKVYTGKSELKRHIRTVHERTNPDVNKIERQFSPQENNSRLIFQCELCNLSFEHEQDFHVHKWVHEFKTATGSELLNDSVTTLDKDFTINKSTTVNELNTFNHFGLETPSMLISTSQSLNDSMTLVDEKFTTTNELTTVNESNNFGLECPDMVISTYNPCELLQPSFDTTDFNILNEEETKTKLNYSEIFQQNIIHEENKIESKTENQEESTTFNELPTVNKITTVNELTTVHDRKKEQNGEIMKTYYHYLSSDNLNEQSKNNMIIVYEGQSLENLEQKILSNDKSVHEGKKDDVIECSFNAKGQIVEEKKSFDEKLVHEGKEFHPNKFTLQILNEEKKKPIKCLMCSMGFENETFLKDHIALTHYGVTSLDCDICDASFAEKSKLNNHKASVHEGKKPFKCTFCDKAYIEKSRLKKHLESHNTCGECNIEFESQQIFLDHINIAHTVKTKTVKTEEKKHLEIPRKMNYKCSFCPYVFQTNFQLGHHYSRFHGGKIPENFELKKKRLRNKPYLSVNNSAEQLNKSLNAHERRNPFVEKIKFKTSKLFICKSCHLQFTELRNLNFHMARIHGEVDSKTLKCNICAKLCRDNCDLKKHMKVHDGKQQLNLKSIKHENMLDNNRDKNLDNNLDKHEGILQCGLCNMRFGLNVIELHDHYTTFHKGMKPFENAEIFIKFGTEDIRIGMILPGKTTTPYRCICMDGFENLEDLTFHFVTVHDVKKLQNSQSDHIENSDINNIPGLFDSIEDVTAAEQDLMTEAAVNSILQF